jgi:hypothetical protein
MGNVDREIVRSFVDWSYNPNGTTGIDNTSNYCWEPYPYRGWPSPYSPYPQPSVTFTTTEGDGKRAIRIAKKMLDEGAVDITTPQEMLGLIELIMEEL